MMINEKMGPKFSAKLIGINQERLEMGLITESETVKHFLQMNFRGTL